ncbi:MAG: hypothetical protein H6R10_2321 [Rhodocyclaceae bacterium]|nr:hypothetical protein [Rhodocyclaceae bacterium]
MKILPALSLSVLLLASTGVMGAPFCSVKGTDRSCKYADLQSCQAAVGSDGTCVANTAKQKPKPQGAPPIILEGNHDVAFTGPRVSEALPVDPREPRSGRERSSR